MAQPWIWSRSSGVRFLGRGITQLTKPRKVIPDRTVNARDSHSDHTKNHYSEHVNQFRNVFPKQCYDTHHFGHLLGVTILGPAMNHELTAAQSTLIDRVRSMTAQHCSPGQERERDLVPLFPTKLLRDMGELGLFDLCSSGQPDGYRQAAFAQEQLAVASTTAATMMFINSAAVTFMTLGGVTDQHVQTLNEARKGRLAFAFALTEPQAGSDASAITTSATADGDEYVLSGEKRYTTGASSAQWILVVAKTSGGPAKSTASVLLVPADADGLTITPRSKVAGDAQATCDLVFNDVRIPVTNLVGGEGEAWSLLRIGGRVERLLVAAAAVGLADRAVNLAIDHLRQREQFGRNVGRFQGVQHQIATLATEVEAMRQLTLFAAWSADASDSPDKAISMAKTFASERGAHVVAECMRLVGGRGYFVDDPLNRSWRESALWLFAGGTSEIQRNIIARSLGL